MTPRPPTSTWLCRAGNGLTMSRTLKQKKATIRTPTVLGRTITESIIPATSSITINPGSFRPERRSIRPPAQMPAKMTPTRVTPREKVENGMSQRRKAAKRLPAVPGATGASPAPPAVAIAKARRSVSRLAHELVSLNLDDADPGEAPGGERAVAQVHDPIDLGRLPRHSPLPRERGILARAVHQDGLNGPVQTLLALPDDAVLGVLNDPRPLGHPLGRHLVGHCRRRRPVLQRVGEDAEAVEADVLDEVEQILEVGLALPRKADEHCRSEGHSRDGSAERLEDLLHPARRDAAPQQW